MRARTLGHVTASLTLAMAGSLIGLPALAAGDAPSSSPVASAQLPPESPTPTLGDPTAATDAPSPTEVTPAPRAKQPRPAAPLATAPAPSPVTATPGSTGVDAGSTAKPTAVLPSPVTSPAAKAAPVGSPATSPAVSAPDPASAPAPVPPNVQLQSAGVFTITALVFQDLNDDGVQQVGEPAAPGAQVELTDTAGGQKPTGTTQPNGEQTFSNVGDGTYSARAWGVPGFFGQPVQVTVAGSNTSVAIPMKPLTASTVHGVVFHDTDADTTRAAGEAPVGDVVVILRDGSTKIEQVTTTPDGSYAFSTQLSPSTVYTVIVEPPSGTTMSKPVNEVNTTTAQAGTDIGVYQAASVSGVAFLDLNRNKIYDPGTDKPLAGTTVALAGPTPVSMITQADGRYSFSNLRPGNYTLTLTVPPEFQAITNPTTLTEPVSLTSGQAEDVSAAMTLPAAGSVGCQDFTSQAQAQQFFDKYYPLVGDFAGLDADNDKKACEQLSSAATTPTTTTTPAATTNRSNTPTTTTSAKSSPTSSSSLAHTGADPSAPVAFAVGLITVGAALVRRTHRG